MKKKIFLTLFLVLTLSFTEVNAGMEPDYPGVNVRISSDECNNNTAYTFTGNVDLLINITDFNANLINDYISDDYKDTYPNYLNNEYLNNTEWISYYAYYENAQVTHPTNCSIGFSSFTDHQNDLINIKLVYFDDAGNTVYTSEELNIEHASWYQIRSGNITFIMSSYRVDNSYSVIFDNFIILLAVLYFILAILMSFTALVFGKALGLFKNKLLKVSLYYVLYYFGMLYLLTFIETYVIGNNFNGEMYWMFILVLAVESVLHGFIHGKGEERRPLIAYYLLINSIFIFFGYFILYL